MSNLEKFLEEYEAICKKYHLIVNGDSIYNEPWLTEVDDEKLIKKHINHLKEMGILNTEIA